MKGRVLIRSRIVAFVFRQIQRKQRHPRRRPVVLSAPVTGGIG